MSNNINIPAVNASDAKVDGREVQMFTVDGEGDSGQVGVKAHQLDSPYYQNLHRRLLGFYQRELDRQNDNRREMSEDCDFYDLIQWRPDDVQVLRERGQMAIQYDVITTTINWLINSQRRLRTDFKVLPRRKDGNDQAKRKTYLLKYLSDVNSSEFELTASFADAVKAGIGWIEDGWQDDTEGEPIYNRHESWRNMLWDSAATRYDLQDGRYMFRQKFVDVDVLQALAPDRTALINNSVAQGDVFGALYNGDWASDSREDFIQNSFGSFSESNYNRPRVRTIECWFRVPEKVPMISGGQFRGEIFDDASQGHIDEVNGGAAVITHKVIMRTKVAIMLANGLLYVADSPYRHNRYPFTPVWGNRRDSDGMPYGAIRALKGLQEDINKRASKALAILSSNKVVMDKGAVDDLDELEEEMAKPNGIIVKNGGKDLVINVDRELAPAHLQIMAQSISMIQQVGGVTDENRGATTNATSGKAIRARQDQGALATLHYFDNLRRSFQISGEKRLSLIEQFMTEEQQFRITNQRGAPTYVIVNDGLPENDITRTKADFVVSETDWNSSRREGQLNELLGVLQQIGTVAPQAVLTMLDLIVESMDIDSRDVLVSRIRQITGMPDPDATEPSPEEIERQRAEQQLKAQQQAIMEAEMRNQNAQAADREASAELKRMNATKAAKEIQAGDRDMTSRDLDMYTKATQIAMLLMQNPELAGMADNLMKQAGYQSLPMQRQAEALQKQQMAEQQQIQADQEQLEMRQQQQQQQQLMQQEIERQKVLKEQDWLKNNTPPSAEADPTGSELSSNISGISQPTNDTLAAGINPNATSQDGQDGE